MKAKYIEKPTFNSEWLIERGFIQDADRLTYHKGEYSVRFTPAGCNLLKKGDFVENFNGWIEDLKNIWAKYTGEKL